MKKRLSKILWFGDALNENNQAAPPALSPSDEEHLQGLNLGEIYMRRRCRPSTVHQDFRRPNCLL